MRTARALALLAASLTFASLTYVVARRLGHPFDLEWLEGATLWHAQRLLDGQPLYPPPSIDFVPHPYPPLYPALLALVGRVTGISYALGRLLSTASFAGALAIGWRFVRAAGGGRAVATAAMAIPCAAFVPTGAWIDLVRVDSLWLLLAAAGTTLAWRARRSPPGVAAAATLLVVAFFAKQTAAPLMLAVALGLLAVDRRAALVFVATLALVGLPALWAMQRATGGWFWFYIYRVHHSHAYVVEAAAQVPGRLALLLLPGVFLAAWALAVDRSPALRWAAWLAAWGVAVSALGKGTQGAYTNALLPGVYFGALFIGTATARLIEGDRETRRAISAWALLGATIAVAPGGVSAAIRVVAPSLYVGRPAMGYWLPSQVPSAEERARGDALLARLRAADGEVWLPARPWYARLAGKRPLAGEMGVSDVAPTGVAVAGFDDALRTRPFAAVVIDEPHDDTLQPLWARATVTHCVGPADVVGHRRISWWLTPR